MTLRALPSAVSCFLPAVAGFLVAEKIDRDPGLLQVAIDNLERRAHMDEHVLPPALVEWQELIARHTWPELCAILVQDTDEGRRLRNPGPFVGISSEEERTAILKAYPRDPAHAA